MNVSALMLNSTYLVYTPALMSSFFFFLFPTAKLCYDVMYAYTT